MIGSRPLTPAEHGRRARSLKTRRLRLTPEQHAHNIDPTDGPPPLAEGKLRNLEQDVLLREAYFVRRSDLEPPLHRLADALVAALKAFPKRYGKPIAEGLTVPHGRVIPRLRGEIAVHLDELGDLHKAVDAALNGAAARWKRFPPERPADMRFPEWKPPADSEESRARMKSAKERLEQIRAQVQAGELLAQWPARSAAGNLLIAWRQSLYEQFAVRTCAGMLAGLGLTVTNDLQWAYTRAIQRAMRSMLEGIAAGETWEGAKELAPPEEVLVSQWADDHRVLTSKSAAEPGRYHTDRVPFLRQIMDDLSPTSQIQRVVLQKAAQIGASEAGNNWIGSVIDQAPGPCMIVQPTVELAKRFSQQRIDTLFQESPRLRDKIRPARSKDSNNTQLMKETIGGIIVLTGSNSAVGLRSMPVRYLLADECDAYPPDAGDEGDPLALARARMRTYSYRAKEFLISTPRIKGTSRIEREYEASDQRRYFVPCPLCQAMQVLEFKQLRWQPQRPETVVYQCEHCGGTFPEHHKTALLAAGEWRATAPTPDTTIRSYHLSGLYSPLGWLSWAEIAKEWEAATGDPDARKTFTNTILGATTEEEVEQIPDWQRLYERRETWPHHTVPERGLFLTAGADIQQDRIEIDIWAWGRGLECWLVEHVVVDGDPGRPDIWTRMDALLTRTWPHETGARLALQRLAIDTGYSTQSVYAWARSQDHATVLPVRGYAAYDRLVPVSGPTKVEVLVDGRKFKRGLNLWTVSSSFFKKEIYKRLGLAKPTDEQLAEGIAFPAGYIHLPASASDEWCRQLVAEQQVIVRNRRGFQARTEWRQLRPRNEALDCLVYARAAVWLAGADRWAEARWRNLEEQLGLEAPAPAPPPPPTPPPETPLAPPAGQIRIHRPMPAPRRARRVWRG